MTSIVRSHAKSIAVLAAVAFAIGVAGCGDATPSTKVKTRSATVTEQPAKQKARQTPKVVSSETATSDQAHPPTTVAVPEQRAEPLPVFRPDDQRHKHDDQKLADLGIHRYESERLVLYSDIDPEVARTLPSIIDQAYRELVDYFGPLAPNRARTEFQMTGFLIKNEALFREAELIPEDLPTFAHGRHRRNEFWMREQKYDYYRRHLLIHEATHCFMTVMPDVEAPVWYMEGMAEYFGAHRLEPDGRAHFRVMPSSPEEFAGFGRINLIRADYAAGRAKTIPGILDLTSIEYLKDEPYAWSWGLCVFLDTHPRYQKRFRGMSAYLQRNAFPTQFIRVFQPDSRDLATEWSLFAQNLQYGYDLVRATIDFQSGTELSDRAPKHHCEIEGNRGWQSSGVLVETGETYQLTATGRVELASQPKPWMSEPQGISFRYFNGRPLGLLLACVRIENGDKDSDLQSMLAEYPVGKGGAFQAPLTGTVYFRVNDAWNSLADNQGSLSVEISAAQKK